MDQTNTDHRCPLKRGNTQSALHLIHNIRNYKYTNIEDLIEIHRIHNIAE